MRNESEKGERDRERGRERAKDRGAAFEPDPSERARHVGREIDDLLQTYHCLRSGLTSRHNFSKSNLGYLSASQRKILQVI